LAKDTISVRVKLADGNNAVAVAVKPHETLAQLRDKALHALNSGQRPPILGLAIDGKIILDLSKTVREVGLTGREEEEVRLVPEQVASGNGAV